MEPLLKEAPPREILVFPLVMVEDPRDVVLRPLLMEEFPTANLLFPLFMEVLPTVKAVFPSVKLVLPIGEALVFLTQIRRRRSGGSRSAKHRTRTQHALLCPSAMVATLATIQRRPECYAWIARPPCGIKPSLSRRTWALEGHISPMCPRE